MKNLKKIISTVMLAVMMIGVVPSVKAEAATTMYGAVPSKVRIYVKEASYPGFIPIYNSGNSLYSINTGINFDYAAYGDTIQNLKTNSKNLKAKQVQEYQFSNDINESYYTSISLYAYKKGKYTVTFDIYDEAGNKKSSHQVKVYAYDDLPVASIKVGNKNMSLEGKTQLVSGNSGKVKVNLNKGYRLKKLEYGVLNKANGVISYTAFKNGKKITFNNEAYSDSHPTPLGITIKQKLVNRNMFADTYLRITYLDKYTKQENTYTYTLFKSVD
jgi:hypothetical protein